MEKIKNDQFEITPIKETPFAVLEEKEKGEVWIILGNEKIMKCENIDWAKKTIAKYDWNILGPVIMKIARFEAQQAVINNNCLEQQATIKIKK